MIAAVLPRGEAIRNFVYSGALDEVASLASLAVLSVQPNATVWQQMQERFGSVTRLVGSRDPRLTRTIGEVLELAHGRHIWSEAARSRWERRDIEATASRMRGVKRRVMKGACLPFANEPGLRLLSSLNAFACERSASAIKYEQMLDLMRADLVFNASHIHSTIAAPVLHAAKRSGIPTVAFIFSWDNLTSQGRIIPEYDHYLVWSASMRDDLLKMYPRVRPEQVTVTGTPQFDSHFKQDKVWSRGEFCQRVGADPSRPIVLYSTGMPNHMPGEDRIVSGLALALREMKHLGSPQLLVRVYPKDTTGRFEQVAKDLPDVLFPKIPWEPRWLTPLEEDSALLSNMLRHCDLGVNVASTVSLELCMFDKPVINVAYDPPEVDVWPVSYPRYYDFDHYRPVVASGAVNVVSEERALAAAIEHAITHPGERSQERATLLKAMFGDTLDGRSASRIARALVDISGAGR